MILGFSGGVGGARMLTGLRNAVGGPNLTCVVNVADDETIYGLDVSPDLDTVTYHLAGLTNWDQGWGIAGDTFRAMDELNARNGSAWFRLGDRDLATHLFRTQARRDGQSLTTITEALCKQLGVDATVVPVSDDPVRTYLHTQHGPRGFQEWFVGGGASEPITGLEFRGADAAALSPQVRSAIEGAEQIVICPSNPMLSIDPMLAIPGLAQLLASHRDRVVAISPIVDGRALRGPAARLFSWLGVEASVIEVARRYRDLAGHFVCDTLDAAHTESIESLGMRVLSTDTIMVDEAAAERLARAVLRWMAP